MPEVIESQPKSVARRDRFREYMKRLNPTAPAREAIEAGLVVDDLHGSLYQKLAARAYLEPSSQQLLAGGVGSGKTTQLLLAADWLLKQGNSMPLYADVIEVADLSQPNSGVLLAAFGVRLAEACLKHLKAASSPEQFKALERARSEVRNFAYGEWGEEPQEDPSDRGLVFFPGKLRRPIPVLEREFYWVREPLQTLLKALRDASLEPVALFDGLDRLLAPGTFWTTVEADIAALRELGVSVVAVAPITVLFELGRSVPDQFDRVHHLPALMVEPEQGGVLVGVLERRAALDLLQPPAAELTCSASGGVLRDLVTLARDAGEEAFVSGADRIGRKHAERAVAQLGTGYLRGLGPEEIRVLSGLARSRSLDLRSDLNLQLLATRRVLEYSPTDFRVHPALLPLVREAEARIA